MKGEFDSAQRETSDAYRENWERIFGAQTELLRRVASKPFVISQWEPNYPNGCPILDEDQRGESVQR